MAIRSQFTEFIFSRAHLLYIFRYVPYTVYQKRMTHDKEYLQHLSITLDLLIIRASVLCHCFMTEGEYRIILTMYSGLKLYLMLTLLSAYTYMTHGHDLAGVEGGKASLLNVDTVYGATWSPKHLHTPRCLTVLINQQTLCLQHVGWSLKFSLTRSYISYLKFERDEGNTGNIVFAKRHVIRAVLSSRNFTRFSSEWVNDPYLTLLWFHHILYVMTSSYYDVNSDKASWCWQIYRHKL